MLESFLWLEIYSSVRVDLICTSLTFWIEVKNGLSEIFKHYTYGLILRFDITLLFSRKSESFYLIYALCLFLVINVTVIFPLGLAELVNRSLLSELGVQYSSGLG